MQKRARHKYQSGLFCLLLLFSLFPIDFNAVAGQSTTGRAIEHSGDQSSCSADLYHLAGGKNFSLRLKSPDGRMLKLPSRNYYADSPFRNVVDEAINGRTPEEQAKINETLKEIHASHEMSFKAKDPSTGKYDAIFKVPVHGQAVPLSKKYYDELVDSTAPIMRALRDLAQKFYATPNPTPENLGISNLPEALQRQVMEVLTDSIYFEPTLVNESMREYPFFPVIGFDAAIGRTDKVTGKFFEFNSGTPSGLSNNIQLIEALREADPKLFATLNARIPNDNTFALLKEIIDSNAKAWTKNNDGISVVISPGKFNGAHPDVESISLFSGMPLVKPSDLYEDSIGNIRLNVGKDEGNPVVTGIYGRAEESFFLQSNDLGIPMIDPHYADNPELGKKWGYDLRAGAIYDFKFDKKAKRIGVHLDESGNPRLLPVYDQIGTDPTRPDSAPGNFATSITKRKLYYSGIGGRLVDDKRIFEVANEHLARRFSPPTLDGSQVIAGPPRTLKPEEMGELVANPEGFVVKDPDKSGGEGVMILVNLDPEKRAQVVEEALQDAKTPTPRLTVQEFADLSVLSSVEKNDSDEWTRGMLANDWRVFSLMGPDGEVIAGPNSFLLRVAKPFSASTNTSQGGAYGIGVILDDVEPTNLIEVAQRRMRESVLPNPGVRKPLPLSGRITLDHFFDFFNRLTQLSDPTQANFRLLSDNLEYTANIQRDLISVLGRKYSPIMTLLRKVKNAEISVTEFHTELLKYREMFLSETDFPSEGVEEIARRALNQYNPYVGSPVAEDLPSRKKLIRDYFSVDEIKSVKVREYISNGIRVSKSEVGRYVESKDPIVQEMIELIQAEGGEIRFIQNTLEDTGEIGSWAPGAYFRIAKNGKPIIGIDFSQDFAISGLAHEMEHFHMWKEIKDGLIKEGMPKKDAAQEANLISLESKNRVIGEMRALRAEIRFEKEVENRLNAARTEGNPSKPWELGYVARMTYPQCEGLRDHLHKIRWSDEKQDPEFIESMLKEMFDIAANARQETADFIRERRILLKSKTGEDVQIELAKLNMLERSMNTRSLFSTVFPPSVLDRFATDETLDDLIATFKQVMEEADLDESHIQLLKNISRDIEAAQQQQ